MVWILIVRADGISAFDFCLIYCCAKSIYIFLPVVADNAWVGGALVVVVVVVGGLVDVVVVLVLTCTVGAALRLKGPQASTLIFMRRGEKSRQQNIPHAERERTSYVQTNWTLCAQMKRSKVRFDFIFNIPEAGQLLLVLAQFDLRLEFRRHLSVDCHYATHIVPVGVEFAFKVVRRTTVKEVATAWILQQSVCITYHWDAFGHICDYMLEYAIGRLSHTIWPAKMKKTLK